ncbi:mCG1030052 [Mus musculus]|nr:mCG1030052 [Mus musculus]
MPYFLGPKNLTDGQIFSSNPAVAAQRKRQPLEQHILLRENSEDKYSLQQTSQMTRK